MAEIVILERVTRFSVLSLKKISLIYISATVLCNNNELNSLILKCDIKKNISEQLAIRNGKTYKSVEAKANELLAKIPVTGKFKEMILEWLWPVTYRIILWKKVYAATISDSFLQYFYWTSEGRIDSKRTGESIVKNRRIPITKRFMLACNLCLRNEIHEIWEDMSTDSKKDLVEETNISGLELFWVRKLERGYHEFSRNFNCTILLAITMGSFETVKYIFSLLPELEKSNKAVLCSLELVIRLGYYPFYTDNRDITFFILSQMTEKSLKQFLKWHSLIVISILLTTEQNEFLEVLKDKLNAISKRDIGKLLHYIFCKFNLDIFKDYDYVNLFISIWQLLEDPCKIWLIGKDIFSSCFCVIISEYFRFLFTKGPSKKAKRTSSFEKLICSNKDKWELLHFFIKNEMVTTSSLTIYRSKLFKLLRVRKSNKFAWRRLLKFVRDSKTKEKEE